MIPVIYPVEWWNYEVVQANLTSDKIEVDTEAWSESR
jgi:hypothetical protein